MAQQKQIHMSLEDRMFIEECLNAGIKKNQIALRLGKDKSTVTKEIRKRSRIEPGISSDDSQDGSEKPYSQKHAADGTSSLASVTAAASLNIVRTTSACILL